MIWSKVAPNLMGFPGGTSVKNSPANAGDVRDTGSIPGSERSTRGGQGNPFLYSCLENPIDSGAWQATVHRVTKSWTRLKQWSMHANTTTLTITKLMMCKRVKSTVYIWYIYLSLIICIFTTGGLSGKAVSSLSSDGTDISRSLE